MTHALEINPITVGISWRENIYLELSILVANSSNAHLRFDLVNGERRFPLESSQQDDGSFLISINVITFRNRKEIPDGEWAIVPAIGQDEGPPAQLNLDVFPHLNDHSRIFMLEGNAEAYTVTFSVTKDEKRPEIHIRTFGFSRITATSRQERTRDWMRLARHRSLKFVLAFVYSFARKTRSKGSTTIVFASERRGSLEGNLKAVRERMLERGLDQRFELRQHVWIAKSRDIKSRLAQVVQIARADYLIIDDFFPGLDLLKIDKSTTIIQAWHAGVGFKAVGYARFGTGGSAPREASHRVYTWAIAGSKNLRSTYADVFGIEPEAIIPTGLPRIDAFLDEDRRTKALTAFAQAYPRVAERRLVLFAPTFRGAGIQDAYYDYDQIDFAALYKWCGEASVIGFRMHHFVTEPVPIPPEYADRFIDLTQWEDGLGLLHSAGVLITDYSSIIYEYSLLNRPMLFFAYDRDAYAATRGFQQDYDATAPGKVCLNSDDLLSALRNSDFELEKVTSFREKNFDKIDTGSSDRFIDWFFLGEMPEEFR